MLEKKCEPDGKQKLRDGRDVDSKIGKTICSILILGMTFFMLGFSGEDNPLIGEWECTPEETMELMDTAHLSDMEKQFYHRYFESIALEVTQDKMVSEIMGQKDSEHYEMVEKKDDAVIVYYPEEDEQDEFELVGEDKLRWSLEDEEGDLMQVVFERQ